MLGTEAAQINQELYIADSQRSMGARATRLVNNYQNERQWKSNFILVEVVSQGYDIKRFLEAMISDKSKSIRVNPEVTQPNIDYFTREQLKQIVDKFKQDARDGKLQDSAMIASALDISTGKIFDQVMARPRKDSAFKLKKTLVAEDTVLTRTTGATCVVTGINQFITHTAMGYFQQTQLITIETYPLKWQVKRLDVDFTTLRNYLLRSFPQTMIPPLPAPSKKKLTYNQT